MGPISPEVSIVISRPTTTGAEVDKTLQQFEQRGVSPKVKTKVEQVNAGINNAVELIFPNMPGEVRGDRQDTVLDVLTGFDYLTRDPHRLGSSPQDGEVSAEDSVRLANFIKRVNALGTINPDGSVTLAKGLHAPGIVSAPIKVAAPQPK